MPKLSLISVRLLMPFFLCSCFFKSKCWMYYSLPVQWMMISKQPAKIAYNLLFRLRCFVIDLLMENLLLDFILFLLQALWYDLFYENDWTVDVLLCSHVCCHNRLFNFYLCPSFNLPVKFNNWDCCWWLLYSLFKSILLCVQIHKVNKIKTQKIR